MTNMYRLLRFHSQISSIIITIFAMITTTMVMNMNWIFDPRTATTHVEGRAAVFQEELRPLSSIIDIIFIIIFTMIIIVVMIRILILSRRRRWAGRQLTGIWKIPTGKEK